MSNTAVNNQLIDAETKINNQLNKINERLNNNNSVSQQAINNANNRLNNSLAIRNTHVNKNNLLSKIGILDPDGLEPNPLTGEAYSQDYLDMAKIWEPMPIYKKADEAITMIYENNVMLVVSGTGSGKTVLTPKFALHALNYQGKIAITNPKRIPTKDNAVFAAKCLDVEVGEQVGYSYRGDKKISDNTNLIFCTDGMVASWLKSDPLLADYDCVIIDEAHERNMNIDLLLLQLKEVVRQRTNFKLIIMSATINADLFINYFPKKEFRFGFLDAGSANPFPIEQIFLPDTTSTFRMNDHGVIMNKDEIIERAVDKAYEILTTTDEGDILVFVPGGRDGNTACTLLHTKLRARNVNKKSKLYCAGLSSGTPSDEKNTTISLTKWKTVNGAPNNGYDRRIVFATDVAESSITLDGMVYVIETGISYITRYYPLTDIQELALRTISKASHDQRKGRVGRTQPGICYSMFSKKEYEKFIPFTVAPVYTENISGNLLSFLAKDPPVISHIDIPFSYKNNKNNKKGGSSNKAVSFSQFLDTFLEPPTIEMVKRTIKKLLILGALELNSKKQLVISDLGRAMARFDLDNPEYAKALICSYNYRCRREMCNLIAMISNSKFNGIGESIFKQPRKKKDKNENRRTQDEFRKAMKKWSSKDGDAVSMIDIAAEYFKQKRDVQEDHNIPINQIPNNLINTNNQMGGYENNQSASWVNKNFLKNKTLKDIKNDAKQLDRRFRDVHYIVKNSGATQFDYIFTNTPPNTTGTVNDRIMRALSEGLITNLVTSAGKGMYRTCYQKQQAVAGMERGSLYAMQKTHAKYAVYMKLEAIGGRKFYNVISRVPPKVIAELKAANPLYKQIIECKSTMPKSNSKPKHNKSSHKKDSKHKKYKKHKKT